MTEQEAEAFEVKQWTEGLSTSGVNVYFEGYLKEKSVVWCLYRSTLEFEWFRVGQWKDKRDGSEVTCQGVNDWDCDSNPAYDEIRVRGLYHLGFEGEAILS